MSILGVFFPTKLSIFYFKRCQSTLKKRPTWGVCLAEMPFIEGVDCNMWLEPPLSGPCFFLKECRPLWCLWKLQKSLWQGTLILKSSLCKGDVTQDYSQRWFLVQHCSNIASLWCTKNCHCKSFCVTSAEETKGPHYNSFPIKLYSSTSYSLYYTYILYIYSTQIIRVNY